MGAPAVSVQQNAACYPFTVAQSEAVVGLRPHQQYRPASMMTIEPGHFDLIVLGTGFEESIVAA